MKAPSLGLQLEDHKISLLQLFKIIRSDSQFNGDYLNNGNRSEQTLDYYTLNKDEYASKL
jgi:hypothetical protein